MKKVPTPTTADAVGSQLGRGVGPLADDSPVLVSISGRLDVLTMNWLRARMVYVRHFGPGDTQACREALEACGHWRGYLNPDKRTWLAVVRASGGQAA